VPKSRDITGLTEREKRFCNEYVIDFNATAAAIRAGYSKKTARRIASENLTKLDIQNYLRTIQQRLQQKIEITQERVLQEYARIAFSNIKNYLKENNCCRTMNELNNDDAAAISLNGNF
jgi:phage terminase small subunit